LTATGGIGAITGAIDWTQVVENTSGDFMIGTATFSGSGAFSGIGSGSIGINVKLGALTCNVSGTCNLGAISDVGGDPPAAFSSVGSGTFGPPPTSSTPEPGTLMLLASGLPALGFVRRRFSRA
jgi:hypothetical protein